ASISIDRFRGRQVISGYFEGPDPDLRWLPGSFGGPPAVRARLLGASGGPGTVRGGSRELPRRGPSAAGPGTGSFGCRRAGQARACAARGSAGDRVELFEGLDGGGEQDAETLPRRRPQVRGRPRETMEDGVAHGVFGAGKGRVEL